MVQKKLRTLLALALSATLCGSSLTPTNLPVLKAASTTEQTKTNDDKNVFKVTLDDSGNITADSSSLEMQRFSWDNATVYFVLTDRFLNSDKSNDHSYGRGMQADGKTPVEGLDTYTNPGTFHGGDLNGLTQKVEEGYFNDLGVNAIWITAPYEQVHGYTSGNKRSNNANTYPDPEAGGFPYYSYHGYWALDYTNIDANMGTAEDFGKFVDSCHEHGIRVVMDIVMNHLGYTTMQDAVDYGFDGALKGDWKTYYYGNATSLMGGDPECENYWDASSSAWSKWWGPGFVKADYPGYTAAGGGDISMSLCGLPDVHTEASAPSVDTPPLMKTKWAQEGRLDQEEKELSEYFGRTGAKKQARHYIIKWLTDWVREYGVDGFRCDTAKHVDMDAWGDLKAEAKVALAEWRENNPDKAGAKWTDDFWMTGECWGHGVGKDSYYSTGGFDSMINFTFPKGGAPSSMEGTYSSYAAQINTDPDFNALSYISSHDDCLTRDGMINSGTDLLLAPGGVQIYYGDETNRPIGWVDWFSSDYTDQRYRTDMNWDSIDEKVLSHWQKLGQFRNKHLSVGAGEHEMLSDSPYTFSRTYHLEEDDEDKVVVSFPGKAGACTVPVGDIFEDGETLTDYYTGEKYEVSGGSVDVTAGTNGVVLLEGSGIVKASVSAKSKIKTETYSADTFEVTLRANKATDTYYSINGGEKTAFKADDVITLGGDTAYGEKTTLTLTGISEDDGSELTKEVTFQRSKEPTVSDGEFALKVKKSDFPNGAPTVYAYSTDGKETPYTGKWPGDAMAEDDDSDYYVYKNEKITDDAMFILVSGTWRSTPDMQPGLVAKGCMLYDKATNDVTEMPSGDPGKVTIKYVDQDGNELKSIYRVGVIGKKYTTYPATIDGYTLTETPDNATGVFEESSEVVYVYSNGGSGTVVKKTPTPTPSDDTDTPTEEPSGSGSDKSTIPPVTDKPAPTNPPTNKPATTPTNKPTNKPTNTPDAGSELGDKNTPTPSPTSTPKVTPKPPVQTPDVPNELSIQSFSVNKKSPQVTKTKLTISATATGGSGNYQYMFYVAKSGNDNQVTWLQKTFKANKSVSWTPTKSGSYTLFVIVKDVDTLKTATKEISYRISSPYFTFKSFTLKKSGKKISMSADVTPSKGTAKYKYVIRKKNAKKALKTLSYSTRKTRIYKVKKAGTYQITLYAKDGSGAIICVTKSIKIS